MPEEKPGTPSIARVYDAMLDGKDNFAADRDVFQRLAAVYPSLPAAVGRHRAFLERAVTWVSDQGISQFIDLGVGMPTPPLTHEIARRERPGAHVAYVDFDPVVTLHFRARVAKGDERITVIDADVRDHAATLAAAASGIHLSEPVCLVMGALLHFLDPGAARALVSAYAAAVTPGSYVIADAGHGDGEAADRFFGLYSAEVTPLYNHSWDEFRGFLNPLELVPPGVTEPHAWLPGRPDALPPTPPGQAQFMAGVGRVP
jgi:O-methyltransferase involved in polyketide biosynthesis